MGRMMAALLSAVVAALALAAGTLHLVLRAVLFGGPPPSARPRGSSAAPPGPPPGGAIPRLPGGIGLEQAFVLNFIAYLVLVALFLVTLRARPIVRAIVDLLVIAVTLATLAGWNSFHQPNPRGLGTVALILELALIAAALAHLLTLWRRLAAERTAIRPA